MNSCDNHATKTSNEAGRLAIRREMPGATRRG